MSSPEETLGRRVEELEKEQAMLRKSMGNIATFGAFGPVGMYTFPNGRMPARQTDGAIGFDAYARAIVDPTSRPSGDNPLRRTMADFMRTPGWKDRIDPELKDFVVDDPEGDPDKYAIVLPNGERRMVGLGFATKMQYPLFYWVAPRSGHASKGITIANSPGTVDPDYTGEAGALIENRSGNDFVIGHDMRVAQILFQIAMIPWLIRLDNHSDIGKTERGAGGFGSTGTHG